MAEFGQYERYGLGRPSYFESNIRDIGGRAKSTIPTTQGAAGSTGVEGPVTSDWLSKSNVGLGLGAVKGATGLANAYTGFKNLELAEDAFDFNKMAADREYAANKRKYENTLARTAAVDKHYGKKPVGLALA